MQMLSIKWNPHIWSSSLVSWLYHLPRQDDCTEVVEEILAGYDEDIYEDNDMNITEEEFVFDTLNNVNFAQRILVKQFI